MKTAKQIKERIRLMEIMKRQDDWKGEKLLNIKLRQLYWVLDDQSGPVEFGEMTS